MESFDDEGSNLTKTVADYHFDDGENGALSFSVLPLKWDEEKSPEHTEELVYLRGIDVESPQKVFIQVIAWKLDLSGDLPEVSVLSKDNNWIKLQKLQKPRKSFEEIIRTILITIHCIHYVKLNPETSERALWDHLRRVFSSYEIRPSENDLLNHVPLIRSMVERDEGLSKSKFFPAFLEGHKKRKAPDQVLHGNLDPKRSKFIVDDDDDVDDNGEESDEETDLFDSVCAICDNGGELLCCEGRCLRSFHATKAAGEDSSCESLGLSKAQVKAIQNFLCANCQHNKHQCFACGKLGSSDKSNGAEVFPCVSATCGNFYHPECVAKLLHPGNDGYGELQKRIGAGEPFTCPVHKCHKHDCKQGENKEVQELQFAICRRCPTAYHRKCLPCEISLEDIPDEGIEQRAWDDLIPNRILIYCEKHKIKPDIGTPVRNHIIFPDIGEKKKVHPSASKVSKGKILVKKEDASEDISRERTVTKKVKNFIKGTSPINDSDSTSDDGLLYRQGLNLQNKSKTSDASKKILMSRPKPVLVKADKSPLVDESNASARWEKMPSHLKEKCMLSGNAGKNVSPTVAPRSNIPSPMEEAEAEKKILALVKKSASSLSLEDIMSKQKLPSTYLHFSRNIDKTITQGKVEHFVEAVRTALQKLEEGGNIEDAKAVCEPEILNQIIKWKNKLKVYLAPFLHGMRYTSFGRHFTKVDKLKEIVDKLHWYVQNGDTVVDFCCGANDFSLLMREKLQESGKQCSFRNFDVIQPKNDFSFEKRDWMTVQPKELPTGSQLIMGLNPPFGVKAGLANKFIDKALEFKPKLLILIVPKETERLDEKEQAYDLIWEDAEKLSGKSFYLPGSVDVNDKQMDQWNLKPPLLYLWSRSDWTERHRAIAIKQGHISKEQEAQVAEENRKEKADQQEEQVADKQEEDHDFYQNLSKMLTDLPVLNDQAEDVQRQEEMSSFEKDMEISPSPLHAAYTQGEGGTELWRIKDEGKETRERNGHGMESSLDKQHVIELENPKDRGHEQKQYRDTSLHRTPEGRPPPKIVSPSKGTDHRSLMDNRPFEAFEDLRGRGGSSEERRHFDAGLPGSSSDFGISYRSRMAHDEDIQDIERRYSVMNRDDPLASRSHMWTTGGSSVGLGGGIQGMDNGLPGYGRDTFGRIPYANELSMVEKYGRDANELSLVEKYGQDGNPQQQQRQIHLYGQQSRLDDIALRNHPYAFDRSAALQGQMGSLSSSSGLGQAGLLPSPFGLSSLSSNSSWTSTSVTQRYAPRLDEMNYARSRNLFIPDAGLGGMFDTHGQHGFHGETKGFAMGPQRPFPQQSSSGWLDE